MRRTRSLILTAAIAVALTACASTDDPAGTASSSEAATSADGAGTAATSSELTFAATDSIQWEDPDKTAAAGTIDLTLICSASVNHSLVFEGVSGDEPVLACDPGAEAAGDIDLEAGTYTFFCNVVGHREAGMEGTLTVS